jgi:hypothetical protein
VERLVIEDGQGVVVGLLLRARVVEHELLGVAVPVPCGAAGASVLEVVAPVLADPHDANGLDLRRRRELVLVHLLADLLDALADDAGEEVVPLPVRVVQEDVVLLRGDEDVPVVDQAPLDLAALRGGDGRPLSTSRLATSAPCRRTSGTSARPRGTLLERLLLLAGAVARGRPPCRPSSSTP